MSSSQLFESFFMGGFECSTHRLHTGRRLDVVAATSHDIIVEADYARLREQGIRTVRDGLRWHLIERRPGQYDFSTFLPALRAADALEMQVIWDVFHYGYPDDIDIFSPEFLDRLARFARAFAAVYKSETDAPLFFCPVNEISYLSWCGADKGYINPFTTGRGNELKRQLVRGAIVATEAVWSELPHARPVQIDPIIHIIPNPKRRNPEAQAAAYNEAQYAGWDMLCGRLDPDLGGHEKYLDIVGVNYYPKNQWLDNSLNVRPTNPKYCPLRVLLKKIADRFSRPIFLAETGTEHRQRPFWFRYVVEEVAASLENGVDINGVCLYPIVNHPGWNDNRRCHNGLWDYPDPLGHREIYQPLADELKRGMKIIDDILSRQKQPRKVA